MFRLILAIQAVVLVGLGAAYAMRPQGTEREFLQELTGIDPLPEVTIPRRTPLQFEPLFDRSDMPEIVSEEELEYALERVKPRFPRKELRPNLVEHALRTWGVNATFDDPAAMSGADMAAFLTDHARFVDSWGADEPELLQPRPGGVGIRWGHFRSASVHHDHWLASLTEAGVTLDTPVYGPGRYDATVEDVLREALRDFRLDEREAEWTAMAFGLWLAPQHEWIGSGGRRYSFDLIASRLMRGHGEKGVCSGTHRVYSLVLLLRLDEQFDEVLSDPVRRQVDRHLERVRDAIRESQFEAGYWPGNWVEGKAAVESPRDEALSVRIIATGHHLEWQAMAPAHLRLPDAQNREAVEWLLQTLRGHSDKDVLANYTFYSHVGNAFALWRKTRPTDFWQAR